jgi:AraC-like DNA-binding protein
MYVLGDVERPAQWVRAWKPEVDGIREVFHARFLDHAYPAHTHDAWTVFTVDEGAIAYDLERRHRGVGRPTVTLLPPHLVHDGRAAGPRGYRKRVLYIGTDVLGEDLIGPAVDRPDVRDPSIVRGFRSLHRALERAGETFAVESIFALLGSRLREHLGVRSVESERGAEGSSIAGDLRDLLEDRLPDTMTLAEAAEVLGVPPARLVRSFTRTFGIAPHRYVVARRIDLARSRLLQGMPVARVAVETGFHDQPHLTRHFRRHVGTTPARYAGTVITTRP